MKEFYFNENLIDKKRKKDREKEKAFLKIICYC